MIINYYELLLIITGYYLDNLKPPVLPDTPMPKA